MAETNSHEAAPFDAGKQRLGIVYAKALLGVTEASGKTAAVLAEFDEFISVLDKLPEVGARLAALKIQSALKKEDKFNILDHAFGKSMSGELLTFLKVVTQHGRGDCVREIHREAHRLFNDLHGRVEVLLRTAHTLDAATLEAVAAKLKTTLQREVVIRQETDPTLIGGLVVRVGDTVYDGSVSNRLSRLRTEAIETTTQAMRSNLDRFVSAT